MEVNFMNLKVAYHEINDTCENSKTEIWKFCQKGSSWPI